MKQHQSFFEKVKFFGLRKLYYILKNLSNITTDALIDSDIIGSSLKQSLLKLRISRTLINTYNGDSGHNIDQKKSFLGFGLIHYALVRNIQPIRVLCVGSRMGFIPAILALACKDNGGGHVDFVDAGYDEHHPIKHWSGIGFWKKNDPGKHFAKIGIAENITSYVMTTKAYAKKFPKKRYQYIYIDGDHSYEGVKLDHALFWPQLETGGFMAFHDIVAQGYLDKGKFGIWKFWKEIQKTHSIVFPFPKESGLGILQKR